MQDKEVVKPQSYLDLKRSVNYRKKAIKHSSRVHFLKRFLPFISFVIIGMIFIWPALNYQIKDKTIQLSEVQQNVIKKNKVLNPKIVSKDKKGQPFTISSLYAEHRGDHSTLFEDPQSNFKTLDGTQLNISSKNAVYDKHECMVHYNGLVHLNSNQSYEIVTDKATYNLDKQLISSLNPVDAKSSTCNIQADKGFDATTDDVKFKGHVNLVIPANNKKAQ